MHFPLPNYCNVRNLKTQLREDQEKNWKSLANQKYSQTAKISANCYDIAGALVPQKNSFEKFLYLHHKLDHHQLLRVSHPAPFEKIHEIC